MALSNVAPKFRGFGRSREGDFDEDKAQCRNEEPGSSADEQRPPALRPQFADIRLEAHRREGDRQEESGRLNDVHFFRMWDQIEAVEQHHRDEPQHEPRHRHTLGPLQAICAEIAVSPTGDDQCQDRLFARRERGEALPERCDELLVLAVDPISLESGLDRVEQVLLAKRLVRNSTAPAFTARTDIGMSPWPVRETIGKLIFAAFSSC